MFIKNGRVIIEHPFSVELMYVNGNVVQVTVDNQVFMEFSVSARPTGVVGAVVTAAPTDGVGSAGNFAEILWPDQTKEDWAIAPRKVGKKRASKTRAVTLNKKHPNETPDEREERLRKNRVYGRRYLAKKAAIAAGVRVVGSK